jgi:hypothetical protein
MKVLHSCDFFVFMRIFAPWVFLKWRWSPLRAYPDLRGSLDSGYGLDVRPLNFPRPHFPKQAAPSRRFGPLGPKRLHEIALNRPQIGLGTVHVPYSHKPRPAGPTLVSAGGRGRQQKERSREAPRIIDRIRRSSA